MFSIRGSPNEENWPGCTDLPVFMEFGPNDPVSLEEKFGMPKEAADLIESMLSLDPKQRPSC